MEPILAVVVGVLYAAGLYMMMRRSLPKLLIGLALISHAANLLIFAAGGLVRDNPPIVPEAATMPTRPYADPLPQALILTAIVISFGVLAFALVLLQRCHEETSASDIDELRSTET